MANEYLSLQRFPGDGVTTDFAVNFAGGSGDNQQGTQPYINVADIKAYEIVPMDGLNPSQRIPRTIVPLGPLTFRVSPAVPDGRFLEIARETEDHFTLVDFKTLQAVSEFDLDLSNRQLLFLTQESSDKSRLAEEAANDATEVSELALLTAEDALQTADGATARAEVAVGIANSAQSQANTATGIANGAVASAQTANNTANAAVQSAANANDTANNALSVAEGIEDIAVNAQTTADGIAATANTAMSMASTASGTAANAYAIAEEALEISSSAGVSTFNGRNGNVTAAYGDYLPNMIPTSLTTNLEDTLLDIQAGFGQVTLRFQGIDSDIDGIDTALSDMESNVTSMLTGKLDVGATAAAATKLATARNINGVAFDGTANVTVEDSTKLPLTGGTLTGDLDIQGGNITLGTNDYQIYGNANEVAIYSPTKASLAVSAGGVIVSGGQFTCTGNITAYSDERLKEDVAVIPDALHKVSQLRGVTYARKDSGDRHTGLIAQEVQAILPEAVVTADDEDGTLSVAYGNLVGLLVEAIKELQEEVRELKRRDT